MNIKNLKIMLLTMFAFIATAASVQAQEITVYKAEDLMKRVSNPDTVYVINFWATWCGPCVKELPEFRKIEEKYAGMPVKVLLVSLDFKDEYKKRIPFFVKKKEIKQEIVWLNETDANSFIPKIENSWQGSIPATLIYAAGPEYRHFDEGTISASNLYPLIEKQIKLL
jgi:thiol-disulfide isomerase/thioredoxin